MKIEIIPEIEITAQQIVDFITGIIAKILAFIAEEEGWVEETTDNVVKF